MKLNKIFFHLSFFIILASMFNIANAGTVYKWIDEDGQVHYGSRTERDDAKEIIIKKHHVDSGNSSRPSSAGERLNKQKRFLNALDAENKSLAEQKKKKKEEEERKLRNCNASRDQLKRYESSGALYDLDEKGNRILLNKKQYEQAMTQANARVQKWCN
jgi:hypothetical protein